MCASACFSALTSESGGHDSSHQAVLNPPWVLWQTLYVRFPLCLSLRCLPHFSMHLPPHPHFSSSLHFPGCLFLSNPHVSHFHPMGLSLPGPIVEPVIIGWCTDSQTMTLNHHEQFCLLENIEEYFVSTWLNFPSLCLPYVGDLCFCVCVHVCVPQRDVPDFTLASVLLTADHSGWGFKQSQS